MRGQAFVAATALAAAFMATAQPAAAQGYPTYHDEHVSTQQQCQRRQSQNTVAGAALGGLAGAALGSNAAVRGHRSDGGILGAVIGAALGGAIANSNTRCAQVPQGSYDPYTGQSYQQYPNGYGQDPYYGRDDSDLEGGPYRESGYYGDSNRYEGRYEDCQMGQVITRDPYGREYRDNVEMCRGADGVWRPRY